MNVPHPKHVIWWVAAVRFTGRLITSLTSTGSGEQCLSQEMVPYTEWSGVLDNERQSTVMTLLTHHFLHRPDALVGEVVHHQGVNDDGDYLRRSLPTVFRSASSTATSNCC